MSLIDPLATAVSNNGFNEPGNFVDPLAAAFSNKNANEPDKLANPHAPSFAFLDKLDTARQNLAEKGETTKAKATVAKIRSYVYAGFARLCIIFTIIVLFLGSLTYFATTNTSREVNYRKCEALVGDRVVKGYRTYSYPYHTFNLRGEKKLVNLKDVTERTVMTLDGKPLTIIGQGEGPWWSEAIGLGDNGEKILKPALQYTFVDGKNIQIISYADFCRAAPETTNPIAVTD